jgi:NAD(P)H dehydrogenase (quinone)
MKNVLIITAHPSSKGFTHKIAENYRQGALERGRDVKLINLYDQENRQDFFMFEDIRNAPLDSKKERIQGLVTWADELVFVYPLWWFGVPAILKNFFDVNFSAGFAYKYKKFPILKGVPVGMLAGKSARVFVTCDGPKILYKLIFTPFKISMKYFTLQFCGIKVRSFVIFDRMRWRDENQRNIWLERVKKMAKKQG